MSDEPNWVEFYQDRRRSHADAYLAFAQTHAQRDPVAHDQLETESGNLLRAADRFWKQNDWQSTLALAGALWEQSDFLRTRGLMQRAIPLLEHACEAAGRIPDLSAECVWHEALGFVHYASGTHAPSLSQYRQALDLAQKTDDACLKARVQLGLGRLQTDLGQLDTAAALLTQALQDYRAVRDRNGEIVTLTALGTLCILQGELSGASEYLERGISLARTMEDAQNEASLLYTLGYVATRSQVWQEAAMHFQAAIEAARAIGDHPLEARSMTSLSEVRLVQGDVQGAATLLEQALALQETTDDILTPYVTRFSLAKVYNVLGDIDRSQALLNQAYPRLVEMRHAPQAAMAAAYAAWIMADNYLKRGEADQARNALHDLLELAPPQLDDLRKAAEARLGSIS